MRKEVPARLILVGEGPEKQGIEQLVRQLGLQHEVTCAGKVADPKEILNIADLFILPSETESFGLAALEAMAAKVPVISTNSGGLPEVNVDGKTGYLCNVGDIDAMAERAVRLLKDPTMLSLFKSNAYQQAVKFDVNAILPQYEQLYRKVIGK